MRKWWKEIIFHWVKVYISGRQSSTTVFVLHLKFCLHLTQCKRHMCLPKRKRDSSRAIPNTRKWYRVCVVIILPFLLSSEVEFFGKCSVKHMFNYFGLCVFLMNVSSYAWAQVIMLNQSL